MQTFSYFNRVTEVAPARETTIRATGSLIASSKYKDVITTIRHCDEAQKKVLKKTLPVVCFSGVFRKRNNNELESYSSLLCLDFDHVSESIEELEELKYKIMEDTDGGAIMCFISPSGTGLKVVVLSGEEKEDHTSIFRQYATYYKNTWELLADEACKDIARACYLSYDPNVMINEAVTLPSWLQLHTYINPQSTTYCSKLNTTNLHPSVLTQQQSNIDTSDLSKLQDIADQCLVRHISIANDYATEYFPILAGIANTFGNDGRVFCRDICALSEKYNANEFEYTYDKVLTGTTPNNHFSFASVIDIAHRYGIYYNVDVEENETVSNLPEIASLLSQVPSPLIDIINEVSSLNEKVVVFFSLLTALSSLMPYTYFYHSKKKYYLNISSLIIGNSGSGKGRCSLSESFLSCFDAYLHSYVREDKCPPYFLVEASDLSEAMLYLDLEFNQRNINKGSCFMLSSELDNISKGKKKEHGVSSAIIRMITEHEPLRQKRKGLDPRLNARDREGFSIAEPKMSFLFCGTSDQVPNYFSNNTNGESARFIPVFLDSSEDYRSGFDDDTGLNLSTICSSLAESKYLSVWQSYLANANEYRCVNTPNQISLFDKYFSELKLKYVKTNDSFSGIVNRIPVHFRRVAGVLQMLEFWSKGCNPPFGDLLISDSVWSFCLSLFSLLEDHFYQLHSSSSCVKSMSTTDRILFYELPDNFTYSEAVQIASKFKYSERTLRRHLSSLIKYKKIVRDFHGNYSKV